MINFKKAFTAAAATGMMFINLVTPALAADHETLFGEAMYVEPGNASFRAVETTSDADPGFGGIDFEIPEGTTFADLDTLSTDYMLTEGACGGGSPRFQVNVIDELGEERNIFVYLGEQPNYTCAEDVWLSTGDLLEAGNFVDATQVGGLFYQEYTTAVALFGDLEVTGVQLVTDAGWSQPDGVQTAVFDNTNIDGTVYDYEPSNAELKEMCKDGGWMDMADADGNDFRNQGQCVSYFARMMH